MVITTTQDAIIRNLVTEVDLICVLERVGKRGRRGTSTLRSVVRSLLPPEGIESALELDLLELVRSCGVDEPVLQYEMKCADGRRVKLDEAWPHKRVAIEADGRLRHAVKKDFEYTMARSRSITGSGWSHYRYGWTDVHQLRAATREEVMTILGYRGSLSS